MLEIAEHGGRFEVTDERIENELPHVGQSDAYFYYRFQKGHPTLNDFSEQRRGLRRESVKPEESILSQVRKDGATSSTMVERTSRSSSRRSGHA